MDVGTAAVIVSAILGFSAPITVAVCKRSSDGDYVRKELFDAEIKNLTEKMKGYESWLQSIDEKIDRLLQRRP